MTQKLQKTTLLPHVLESQSLKVLCLTTRDHQDFGKNVQFGDEQDFKDILEEKLKFDQIICTPEIFKKVIKLAPFLGPRGLMPSPAKG